MDRTAVASSNVSSVGYDPASQTLEIQFHNGSIYQYYNVTETVYENLMQSPSKGGYLNTYIKNSHPYSRVG
ncbi:KTSC domain-containing protein [Nitrospirillum bahiense]|uniref:KTSC domain-containing protein n=1 Tax=Nitrospirillum amazonense TaxID=28077 RepID=UPI0011A6A8A1|nr:KTSC domain-containing protein [Nitrospirillum amazonense]